MPNLGQFRQYNETDVIQLYKYADAYPVNKGTFVKIGSGWLSDVNTVDLDTIATVGQEYTNTVSTRYTLPAFVNICTSSGDAAIGMLLYDGRETDENGEKLLYNPRKAAENDWFISGQAAPIVTKGVFLYSGAAGTPSAGGNAYLGSDAAATSAGAAFDTTVTKVGKFLGPEDALGFALLKLDL